MIWEQFGDSTTDAIIHNTYAQWGAVGILVMLAGAIIVYLLRENKSLQKEISNLREKNSELQEKRLQDVKDSAKATLVPFQEFTNFVRTLYELSINSNNGRRSK